MADGLPSSTLALDHKFRHPQQHALDLRVREGADRFTRRRGELVGLSIRGIDRTIAIQNGNDVCWSYAIKPTVSQHRLDCRSLFRCTPLHRVEDRERGLTFAQIARYRLAQHFLRSG